MIGKDLLIRKYLNNLTNRDPFRNSDEILIRTYGKDLDELGPGTQVTKHSREVGPCCRKTWEEVDLAPLDDQVQEAPLPRSIAWRHSPT